jgi:hypothetical protein
VIILKLIGGDSMDTRRIVQQAIICANRMYGYLEDLNDVLSELTDDDNLTYDEQIALEECRAALNEPELLDELIARLGCIKQGLEEE